MGTEWGHFGEMVWRSQGLLLGTGVQILAPVLPVTLAPGDPAPMASSGVQINVHFPTLNLQNVNAWVEVGGQLLGASSFEHM